jgi:type II secretory pathway pseudopilin PulG
MLVVIAIIGILAAIGIQSYLSYRDRARVDGAAAAVSQLVSVATAHARKQSSVVTIRINPTTRLIQALTGTTTLYSQTLALTSMTLTCRQAACSTGTNTFTLQSPGGGFPDDLAFTLTSNGRSQNLKVIGPSAMVVYR